MIAVAAIDLWGGLTEIADSFDALRWVVFVLIVSHILLVCLLVGLISFARGFISVLSRQLDEELGGDDS